MLGSKEISPVPRSFYIFTYHKPLIYLFSKTKGIPTLESGRIQRWALTLSSYQYKIVHRPGKEIFNADGLSRLPLPKSHSVGYPLPLPKSHSIGHPLPLPKSHSVGPPLPADIVGLIHYLNSTPLTVKEIRKETYRDPILTQVCNLVKFGWHTDDSPAVEFLPYHQQKDELSVAQGCLLRGN